MLLTTYVRGSIWPKSDSLLEWVTPLSDWVTDLRVTDPFEALYLTTKEEKEEGSSRYPNNHDKMLLHIPLEGDEIVELKCHMAAALCAQILQFLKVFVILNFSPLLILIMIALSISKTLFIFKSLYEHYLIN